MTGDSFVIGTLAVIGLIAMAVMFTLGVSRMIIAFVQYIDRIVRKFR